MQLVPCTQELCSDSWTDPATNSTTFFNRAPYLGPMSISLGINPQ